MNKHLRLLPFILIFAAVMTIDGAAEHLSVEADVFDDIKLQMISSSEENKRLAAENKTLKARLVSLQLEVEQYEQEIEELDPQYMKARELPEKQGKKSTGGNDTEDDDLIQEARNIYLSGQSMALDDAQRLRELQLYDLQYQKQELESDLRSMELSRQRISGQRRPELDALEGDIQANIAKTRDLSVKIDGQEKAALAYPREIDLLRMENKALKQRISQLKYKKGPGPFWAIAEKLAF